MRFSFYTIIINTHANKTKQIRLSLIAYFFMYSDLYGSIVFSKDSTLSSKEYIVFF